MFGKPKFKKVDTISYKGYDIPIYSNGISDYVGHPTDEGEEMETNRIYTIDAIPEIKNAIYHIVNGKGGDELYPESVGTIRISSKK